jgi:uncharacterized protein YlxW (UPF0749 family)
MRRLFWIAVLSGVCLAAPENTSAPQTQSEARLLVLESKVSDLQASNVALNTKLDKLGDKIDKLSEDVIALKTQVSFIQWFGGAFGVVIVGSLWKLLTQRSEIATHPVSGTASGTQVPL